MCSSDLDGIESEYGERMRRVNEDLRVAKARCNKYRQIQQELESQLAQEQAKGRDLGDKNRALKDKVRAYTALGGKDGTPFDPSTYQNKLQEKDDKIKQLEKDVEVLKKSLQQAERRDKNKATLDAAGEGLSALKNAIQVLKDFYKGATKPSSQRYLQVSETASPVDQDMAAAGTGVHHGSYTGNQAQAGGILGMLATIQSDFERTISETTAAEQAAHRDYVKFDIETKASLRSEEHTSELQSP